MRQTPPSGVRRILPLGAAVGSETGIVREENQDRVAVARGRDKAGRTFAIAAIADGIGGMKAGAICASDALAALFASTFRSSQQSDIPEAWLEAAFVDANQAVHAKHKLSGGTTLVALLLVEGHSGCWASVGDSRLYAASETELTQLSKDDTIAGQLGKRPDIRMEQSKLLQFIGIGEPLEIQVEPVKAGIHELALLTTDGVHFLERSGGVFGAVIHHSPDPGTCVRRLTELSRWAGGPDNASAIAMPFHPELGTNPAPSHCLDVWDPFGELRIAEVQSAPELRGGAPPDIRPASVGRRETPPSENVVIEEAPACATDESSEPQPIDKKQKRKRKSRKKPDLLGGKAPQVQLEFSGKDD